VSPVYGNLEQLFDLIASELPEDMFSQDRANSPDPTKRSVTSSEVRDYATILNDLYTQLLQVSADKTASTASMAAIARWEKMLFAEPQDQSQPDLTRVNNVLAKIRALGGISYAVIYLIVSALFEGSGLTFQISPFSWADNEGTWVLDVSPLDVGTYLSSGDPILGTRRDSPYVPLDDNLDYVAAGLTLEQLLGIQATAYTYELRIFGTASATLLAILDRKLTEVEPARSTHVIRNNFPGPIAP
jgi:hypothetical protein